MCRSFSLKIISTVPGPQFDQGLVDLFIKEFYIYKQKVEAENLEKNRKKEVSLSGFLADFFVNHGHQETFAHTFRTSVLAHNIFDSLLETREGLVFFKRLTGISRMTRKKKAGIDKIIGLCSQNHDIGKLAIPKRILYKKGKLLPAEFAIIKQHTEWGEYILKECGADTIMQATALSHHETLNGENGYPQGRPYPLRDLTSFIVALIAFADSYEAMISDRSYRDKLSRSKVISELKNNLGGQWPGLFVNVLLENIYLTRARINSTVFQIKKISPSTFVIIHNEGQRYLLKKDLISNKSEFDAWLKKTFPSKRAADKLKNILIRMAISDLYLLSD